jgi:hypothetical protein
MYFGILTSTVTIRSHFFQEISFQKFLTLNFVQGFVFGGIFNFAFSQENHSTSILHHKSKSNKGTS